MTTDPNILFEGTVTKLGSDYASIVISADNAFRTSYWHEHLNGRRVRVVAADPAPTDPHTRTSTPHGPDFCAECSADIRQWVHWPCGGSARMAADPTPTAHITPDKFVSKVAQEAEAFRAVDPAPTGDQP